MSRTRAFGATSRSAASRCTAPRALTANARAGSWWLFATELNPARCTTASGRAVSTASRTLGAWVTSNDASGPCASKTESPSRRRCAQRCRPTNPLAPVTRTRTPLSRPRLQPLEVRVDHQLHELAEVHRPFPAELPSRFGGIADQYVYLRGPDERGVDVDVALPVESHVREGDLAELLHAVVLVRSDDVVFGRVGLEHPPHRVDVVGRIPPVAFRLQVPEREPLLHPELDARDRV